MKIFNVLLVVVCLFGFGTTGQAQNAIPASGGNASFPLFPESHRQSKRN